MPVSVMSCCFVAELMSIKSVFCSAFLVSAFAAGADFLSVVFVCAAADPTASETASKTNMIRTIVFFIFGILLNILFRTSTSLHTSVRLVRGVNWIDPSTTSIPIDLMAVQAGICDDIADIADGLLIPGLRSLVCGSPSLREFVRELHPFRIVHRNRLAVLAAPAGR